LPIIFRRAVLVLVLAAFGLFGTATPAAPASQDSPPGLTSRDYAFPEEISLCGEKMPLEDRHVWEMMDREFTIAVWDIPQVYMWLKRKGRYFPYIEKSLAEQGVPDDIKYLAVAESSLIIDIRSRRSALGVWQFMADTARRMGLRVDRDMDERLHFERSTQAALKFITQLKDDLGTWTLALSAYNCGGACIKNAIDEQQVTNYYRLNLPLETERFIYRIAAAKIIMENPERYGFNLPEDRIYQPSRTQNVKVNLHYPVDILEIAQELGTDYKALKELNLHIKGDRFPTGQYEITVPEKQEKALNSALKQATKKAKKQQSAASGQYYVVQKGDTLTHISLKTGVPVSRIKKLNNIRGSLIKTGQKLRLSP